MHDLQQPLMFDSTTQKNIALWLEGHYDAETKSQILHLIKENPQEVMDSFYTHLTFGTGGLRGLIGIGSNRMNVYTVRAATQGLAHYIQTQPKKPRQRHAVFVGYDSRQDSKIFAEETAKVLAGNDIQVYLFKELRPTPFVSFGCRFKTCIAGVMITASHNPPAYNGYKVFWSDGGQVVAPHDQGIIEQMRKVIDPSMINKVASLPHPLIEEVHTEIDDVYLASIAKLQHYPDINQREGHRLKLVYTSLHGTGMTIIPKVLQSWGFPSLRYVDSQIIPDGSFPSVASPNPEEPAALKMGIELMLASKSDLLLATDPDADRVGVAVRHQNEAVLLSGNQIAVLCLEHVCRALSAQNRFPSNAAFIKTIGTTELFQAICQAYQRPCFNVLTGFKYIAEKIHEWETEPHGYQFIFGGEESHGYLLGSFTRDKDAVISSALIAEVALQAKRQEKTLIDKLHELYHQYGVYQEESLSLHFGETKEGKEQMALSMRMLRSSQFHQISDLAVIAIEDYLNSTKFYLKSQHTKRLLLPISNILLYWLEDGTKVMIRPSGTEPKVKIYCGVFEKQFATVAEGIAICRKKCQAILEFLKLQLMRGA